MANRSSLGSPRQTQPITRQNRGNRFQHFVLKQVQNNKNVRNKVWHKFLTLKFQHGTDMHALRINNNNFI